MDIASCKSEDYLSSVESVTSGLSSYEDELGEIKSIVSSTSRNNNCYCNKSRIDYEFRIAALQNELKNVHLIYESYKTETSNKTKKNDLDAHEKFKTLFNQNLLLELQLSNANACIKTTKSEASIENYELKNEILQLKNELNIWKGKFENLNRRERDLKLSIEESNQRLDIRNKVIEDLKVKISELYVELQDFKKKEWRNQSDLLGSKNESSRQLKNLKWYKERLLSCQNEKFEACKEIVQLKSLLSSKSLEIKRLSSEKDGLIIKFQEVQRELDKCKLEVIHKNNLEAAETYKKDFKNMEVYKTPTRNKCKKENSDYLLKTTNFITILCQICDNFLKDGVLKNLFKDNLSIKVNVDVLDAYFAKINKKYKAYDIKMDLLKSLKLLEERCLQMKQKSDFLDSFLKTNFNNVVEENRIFAKVRELEMEENVKRYERNTRTLLRKTKEQLKERIVVEKELKHLQSINDLNNKTIKELKEKLINETSENNKRSVEIARKNCTIDNLNKMLKDGESKSSKEVLRKTCCQNDGLCVKEELKVRDDIINEYKKETLNLKAENEKLKQALDSFKNIEEKLVTTNLKQEDTNRYLQNEKIASDNLRKELNKIQNNHASCLTTINNLEATSNELEERNIYYAKEIEILKNNLKHKEDEFLFLNQENEEIKMEKAHFEELLSQKQLEIHNLYEELRYTNQDKYFYQRLSNDLKIALNTSMKQNEILKEQLYNRSVDAGYHSLSDVTPNPPTVFNENCINDLLLRFNAINSNKPVQQLKDGMAGLKSQMNLLKQELLAKNFITSN